MTSEALSLNISEETLSLARRAEARVSYSFAEIDRVSEENTRRVLAAFARHRVSESLFAGSTGYGYDDRGRDTLDEIYADLFGGEKGLVRLQFVNGTHAITCALWAVVRPGDVLLSAVGGPYDTLRGVVGIEGDVPGNLRSYGVDYREVAPLPDGMPDLMGVRRAAADPRVGAVLLQRSRGYSTRKTLTVEMIRELCRAVREVNPRANLLVDNCYGEFVEAGEPCAAGADLCVGSLIKNPGGGLAPTGGYVVGRADLVDAAAGRLTAPGIGGEVGATLGQNRLLYQGLFLAPHTVAQALKTAVFAAAALEELGYEVDPGPLERRADIIQQVAFGAPEPLLRFCQGIQKGAPVDSFVKPEPWAMPGYNDPVVMAAGAFIQGASIELSCDAPMRPPYVCYLQGGLTYESGKTGVLLALEELKRCL